MKRKTLLVLAALALGLQGVYAGSAGAQEMFSASTFPSDAEASYDLPAIETYADRMVRLGDRPEAWGVSRREVTPHDPFPFGGGYIDD